jgi:hypothetical protein
LRTWANHLPVGDVACLEDKVDLQRVQYTERIQIVPARTEKADHFRTSVQHLVAVRLVVTAPAFLEESYA